MNRRTAIPHQRERGQDLVEFAIIFPILFLILMGIFDLGRATYYNAAIYNAAREGARYGIVAPDDIAGIDTATRRLLIGLGPADITVTPTFPDEDTIQVVVEYQMTLVTPVIRSFFGNAGTIQLHSQAIMRLEE